MQGGKLKHNSRFSHRENAGMEWLYIGLTLLAAVLAVLANALPIYEHYIERKERKSKKDLSPEIKPNHNRLVKKRGRNG